MNVSVNLNEVFLLVVQFHLTYLLSYRVSHVGMHIKKSTSTRKAAWYLLHHIVMEQYVFICLVASVWAVKLSLPAPHKYIYI